ncbi:YjbF family lipoprotein [Grimontia hollisae]|uniref:YjbF family lipoprotein n=1 Tax=Grimontia hollisae TaxID=673 RepID=UPI001303A574|nr:YjbF family lipoprotein [Grimontia hollisae]
MKMKQPLTFSMLALVFVSLLSGCSQKYQDVQDTLSLALFGYDDVTLPPEQVIDLPYASLYATVEGSAQAFLVLAYAEKTFSTNPALSGTHRLKWLSANNEMLVTESGRLVKTVNLLGGNLTASYGDEADPLALGLLNASTPRTWARQVDWQPGNYSGVTLNAVFEPRGLQTIMVNEKPVEALLFIESVSAAELGVQFENAFWISPSSGRVIASRQTPAPGLADIEITVLKPFAGEE